MNLSRRTLLLGGASLLALREARAASNPRRVGLALQLGIDVSGSVSQSRHDDQMHGYAKGLMHKDVLQAIRGSEEGAIDLRAFYWATLQHECVPWTRLDTPESVKRFCDRLLLSVRPTNSDSCDLSPRAKVKKKTAAGQRGPLGYQIPDPGNTWIGGAIIHASNTFLPEHEHVRKVLDISGDGPDNVSGSLLLEEVRKRAIELGITINGLPIIMDELCTPQGQLYEYYRDYVVGGPGAILIRAEGMGDFENALIQKLRREIS